MFRYFFLFAVLIFTPVALLANTVADLKLASINDKDLPTSWGNAIWSSPQKDGNVSYRTKLAKYGEGGVYASVWWSKGQLRPNEGDFFLATVKYKDTLKKPAWFASLSGTDGWMTNMPVLGFGGDNNGKWKEAQIPLPWDYISHVYMPQNKAAHKPDKTLFTIQSREDVSIAFIKIDKVEKTPELAAKYFEDLRKVRYAINKASQDKKPPHKPSVVPGLKGNVAAFPHSADVVLLPSNAPKADQVGQAVKVRMTRNEFQPATFGVFANTDLTNVTYTVKGLDGLNVKTKTASYSLTNRGSKGDIWMVNAWYPMYAVDIKKGLSHSFLIDIKSDKTSTAAKVYKGTIDIKSDQGTTSLPLEVTVEDVVLLTINEIGLTYGDSMACLTPISDVRERMDYNQNSALLWYSSVHPRMWFEKGKMKLGFDLIDDWMVNAKKAGVENVVYFLGGEPFKFPYNWNLPRDIIARKKGGSALKGFTNSVTKKNPKLPSSVRGDVVTWLKMVDAHAKKAGWPTIHFTPFDEPSKWTRTTRHKGLGSGPWIKEAWIDYAQLIKKTLPHAKIYASIHEEIHGGHNNVGTILEPYINSFCSNAIGRYPVQGERLLKAVAKRKNSKNPLQFWQYGFVGDNDPGAIRFSYGFFFGGWGSTGSMGWAYSNGGSSHDVHANARKAWPTPFGVLPRATYIGLREGGDDRRLIATCQKAFKGDAKKMAVLNKILKAGREGQSKSKGGKDLVYDFWETTDNIQHLENWRHQLLDLL